MVNEDSRRSSHHRRNKGEQTKIVFRLDPGDWHGFATESLWAEPIAPDRFRLNSSPFFAFDISAGDIIAAHHREGKLVFDRVTLRGGHSTYRLFIFDKSKREFQARWESLESLGCSYEEGPVLAVDVPQAADIYKVYSLLEQGERAGIWEFEEGHCGHSLGQ